MVRLQELIHTIEEGRGSRFILLAIACLGFIALALLYDIRCFKNFATQEAMDSAQLARNISQGKGYTTQFVRPLSIHLLREHRKDQDPLLKTDHPDLANPPVYPSVLAGLLRVAPVDYEIPPKKMFLTYEPERWIAALNQILFFCAALLVFKLAAKLFDRPVAWISVAIFIGAELLWRFSVSGLSTMLLMVTVLGITWCLVQIDHWQHEEFPPLQKILGLSVVTGVLTGLAALTRYSFLWLIIPALLFTALFHVRFRAKASVLLLAGFLVVFTPWIVRNFVVSGTPFGTSSYVVCEQTGAFPEDTLQRSLNPQSNFEKLTLNNFGRKFLVNIRGIFQNELPKLGGSWVTAFFLASLLLPFRNKSLSNLRIFLLAALALFVVVQAGGRTALSDAYPEVNSENLLVIFAPLVFIYGVAFYFTLLDQLDFSIPGLRPAVTSLFVVLGCMPLIFSVLPPRSYAYAYPPYYPGLIQQCSHWMKEKELVMSDLPASVAWYGQRQCIQLTLDYDKEFYSINDDLKPIQAVYLSPNIMDSRFDTQMFRPAARNEKTWGRFVFESLSAGQVIAGFPLKKCRLDYLPDHFFVTDRDRWPARKK